MIVFLICGCVVVVGVVMFCWIRWLNVLSDVFVFLLIVIMICLNGIVVMLLVVNMFGIDVVLCVLMMILLCFDSLIVFFSYLVFGMRLICMNMFLRLMCFVLLECRFL